MPYGILKVDTITFTAGGVDTSVSISGLVQNPTFTGNITSTGTISGNIIQGGTTVSGATVTGTTANFVTVSGTTVTGGTARFTTLTGVSGVFTSSVSGVTLLTSTGVFASGTAAAPSITFNGDLDTGLFTGAANTVGISANGSAVLTVSGTSVGIGTNSPNAVLDLTATAGAGGQTSVIRFGLGTTAESWIGVANGAGNIIANSAQGDTVIRNDGGKILLSTDSGTTAHAVIDSSGRLGIGTSSPSSALDVSGAISLGAVALPSAGTARIFSRNTDSNLYIQTGSGNTLNLLDGSQNTMASFGSSTVTLQTGNSPRLSIDSSGRVGIGVTSPTGTLEVGAVTGAVTAGDLTVTTGSTTAKVTIGRLSTTSNDNTTFRIRDRIDRDVLVVDGGAFVYSQSGSERARIDSSGRLLIGTSSSRTVLNAAGSLQIEGTGGASTVSITNTNSADEAPSLNFAKTKNGSIVANGDTVAQITFNADDGADINQAAAWILANVDGVPSSNVMPGRLTFSTNGGTSGASPTARMIIKNDGIVLINTTQGQTGTGANDRFQLNSNLLLLNATNVYSRLATDSGSLRLIANAFPANLGSNSSIILEAGTSGGGGPVELARFRSDGVVGIGTTSPAVRLHVDGDAATSVRINGSSQGGAAVFQRAGTTTGLIGNLGFILGTTSSGLGLFAETGFDIRIFTNGSATEKARFNTTGDFAMGASVGTPGSYSNTGVSIGGDGYILASRAAANILYVNRKTDDGGLVEFAQADTAEGSISVSGTTVSYNGAHLSRWSQIPGIDPHDKAVRPEILRGTVMSNLDEMCDWIDPESGDAQANEQLNKTKISDIEGDKNVAGVFQSWDDDDETWVNDYYLAVTGDFVIRIAGGVTVERGDLLMSAGDGTAKPQIDDAVRSCTIAKVISTHISHTFDDGSYCVPCVLMAC